MKNNQQSKGFTIVELLIVIVVIAILAAITIIAYNNVSSRGKDTSDKADAASLLKITEAFYAETGSYPQGTSTATLKTSYASATTSKIPAAIDIAYVTAPPANASAAASADATNTFSVWPCAAGANIYYAGRVAGAIQTFKAGAGC